MYSKLVVSSAPHIRGPFTVQTVMTDVLVALVPAVAAAGWFFGLRALALIAVVAVACVAAEALWQHAFGKPIAVGDCSALVTGVLLAMNLPPTLPFWTAVVGAFFAIIVAKQFFGGLGKNIVNPALAARAFLLVSWPAAMTTWTLDGVTAATPLAILRTADPALPPLLDVFTGNVAGCLGETSVVALLLGGAWLLWRRVITPEIPVVYIGTTALLTWILGRSGFFAGDALYEIFTGGLFLGAIFMATDYVTSPMTVKGRILYAFGCGVVTTAIRLYGNYPEGVSFAILIMNLATPLIDRVVKPRRFGAFNATGTDAGGR